MRDGQLRGKQKRLRAGYTDATDVFADGAAEAAMKLAADLDGMAIGRASQVSECEPRTGFFMEHLANAGGATREWESQATKAPSLLSAKALRSVLPRRERRGRRSAAILREVACTI